jgi:hypothetical protein
MRLRAIAFGIVGGVLIFATGASAGHYIKPRVVTHTITKTITKDVTASAPPPQTPASFHIGDSQTLGSLTMKVASVNPATTMGELPPGLKVINIGLTVTNNSDEPYTNSDAFVNDSLLYAQVGKDTGTGKYVNAYTTPCFGGGKVVILPHESQSGCVQFVMDTNALADTYFYNGLKWYL